MDVSLFDFSLPDELIARRPTVERRDSRLLCLTHGGLAHRQFVDLLGELDARDLLVFNDTRVMAARLFGQKETGGQVEILVERVLNDSELLCHLRASKSPRAGSWIILDGGQRMEMLGRRGELFHLRLAHGNIFDVMEKVGHVPLPPYIDRSDDEADMERYQTVYAKHMGAVAAPTAGLHFDTALLDEIRALGVGAGFITLHVGAGTFQPVRESTVEKHHMHSEWYAVGEELVEQVAEARARGGRVIAVGTTSLRALEAASQDGSLRAGQGDTDIFIYPGYRFRQVDALVTNFHLPRSTLLMLISAFAGRERVLAAYAEAVAQHYRFFSYGDAMFIEREKQP